MRMPSSAASSRPATTSSNRSHASSSLIWPTPWTKVAARPSSTGRAATARRIEVLGDFTAQQCKQLAISGPTQHPFGAGTYLVPALHYFCERFAAARRGMFLFLTDGKIDDLDDVKRYSEELAKLVFSGQRNPLKCVLIGVGDKVDEHQMRELDELRNETGVALWDHKIAHNLRDLRDVFAEVVDENQIVAEREDLRLLRRTGKDLSPWHAGPRHVPHDRQLAVLRSGTARAADSADRGSPGAADGAGESGLIGPSYVSYSPRCSSGTSSAAQADLVTARLEGRIGADGESSSTG